MPSHRFHPNEVVESHVQSDREYATYYVSLNSQLIKLGLVAFS